MDSPSLRRSRALVASLLLAACSSTTTGPTTTPDAALPEVGRPDVSPPDLPPSDLGPTDVPTPDTGFVDTAAPPDTAAPTDLGAPDRTPPSDHEDVREASVDVPPDVGLPDVDLPDVDLPDVPPGPLDGAWQVTEILCAGEPASSTARLYITPPNSSWFLVRGGRSVYTLSTSICTMRLESNVTYPTPGRAVFTATGPFTCEPSRCAPGCELTPPISYVYDYVRRDGGLEMTTVGETPDVTCTAYGQSNPIRYTYSPR